MHQRGLYVTCRKDSEGPVGIGTTYTDKTRLGTVTGEVAVFEPPRRVVFHYTDHMFGRKTMDGWPGYALEPEGESSTRLHHFAEAYVYGLYRLFEPVLRGIAHRERRRTVDALKASLESPA